MVDDIKKKKEGVDIYNHLKKKNFLGRMKKGELEGKVGGRRREKGERKGKKAQLEGMIHK